MDMDMHACVKLATDKTVQGITRFISTRNCIFPGGRAQNVVLKIIAGYASNNQGDSQKTHSPRKFLPICGATRQ